MKKLFQKLINLVRKFGINANKIELSANDILNLLAGNTINLSSKNLVISSTDFNVNKDGKVTCSNINITGGNINLQDNGNYDSAKVTSYNSNTGNKSYLYSKGFTTKTPNNNYEGSFTNNFFAISKSTNGGLSNDLQIAANIENQNNEPELVVSNKNNSTKILANNITTPSLTQTSLESQKKNFEKLGHALEIIKDVDIYKYNLKNEEDGTKKHIGFVIGDNYKYSKELTSNNNDGVDIYSLASCCLAGIKEQQKIIDTLQQEIKELKEVK